MLSHNCLLTELQVQMPQDAQEGTSEATFQVKNNKY